MAITIDTLNTHWQCKHNDTATVRSVFIIGPDKQLKLPMTYPLTVGRNLAEVIRALDAFQLSTSKGVATPADWQVGQDVMIPVAVNDADAETKFGKFEKRLSYVSTVKLD
jgi:alkyl hydroperoxide reductase subunit AhpC